MFILACQKLTHMTTMQPPVQTLLPRLWIGLISLLAASRPSLLRADRSYIKLSSCTFQRVPGADQPSSEPIHKVIPGTCYVQQDISLTAFSRYLIDLLEKHEEFGKKHRQAPSLPEGGETILVQIRSGYCGDRTWYLTRPFLQAPWKCQEKVFDWDAVENRLTPIEELEQPLRGDYAKLPFFGLWAYWHSSISVIEAAPGMESYVCFSGRLDYLLLGGLFALVLLVLILLKPDQEELSYLPEQQEEGDDAV